VQLIVTLAKLTRPGGARSVIAESLLLKQQILLARRCRRRAPPLTTIDRFVLGLITLFVRPRRVAKLAAILKPATLLRFDKALVNRKYRRLFSSTGARRKPGPKGPTEEIVAAILDLFRCESILLHSHWVPVIIDVFTRRIIGFGIGGQYIDGPIVCRMFNQAIAGHAPPARLSTDHDPLFRFHRWLANLRILEVEEIKSVAYAPMSHPFVERLVGTIRREYLDHTPFWNSIDLHRKLDAFRIYYNAVRVHRSLNGTTPANRAANASSVKAKLAHYAWERHCNGLFETPVAA